MEISTWQSGCAHTHEVILILFQPLLIPQGLKTTIGCASLIFATDGQVTRSVDLADGMLSPQEQATVNAIVNASKYALSIVLVGVGDGPWETMKQFDDFLPARAFDNSSSSTSRR